MPNEITISSINGTPPYDIYVCDISNTYCYLVSGGTTIPPSYSFYIPPPLDNVGSVLIKIIDSTGCETFTPYVCPTASPTPTPTMTPTPSPTFLCYCITVFGGGSTGTTFNYIDCNSDQQNNVFVNSGTTAYVCGIHPEIVSGDGRIGFSGGFCSSNYSCPAPTCTPTPTPTESPKP